LTNVVVITACTLALVPVQPLLQAVNPLLHHQVLLDEVSLGHVHQPVRPHALLDAVVLPDKLLADKGLFVLWGRVVKSSSESSEKLDSLARVTLRIGTPSWFWCLSDAGLEEALEDTPRVVSRYWMVSPP